MFVPVYLNAGGKESITAAEIIPAGDLSPLVTGLPRHLTPLPWLMPSIHPATHQPSLYPPLHFSLSPRPHAASLPPSLPTPLCPDPPMPQLTPRHQRGVTEKKGSQREVDERGEAGGESSAGEGVSHTCACACAHSWFSPQNSFKYRRRAARTRSRSRTFL